MPKFNVVHGNRARAGGEATPSAPETPKKEAKSGGGGVWMLLLGVAGGALGYHFLLRNAQSFMGGGMNLQGRGQPQVAGARGRFLSATQPAPVAGQVQYVPVAPQPQAPVVMEEIEVLE